MSINKQHVLEDMLNDSVDKIESGVYFWQSRFYQVIYYPLLLRNKKLKASHFIKWEYKGKTFGIRELSEKLLKKILDK